MPDMKFYFWEEPQVEVEDFVPSAEYGLIDAENPPPEGAVLVETQEGLDALVAQHEKKSAKLIEAIECEGEDADLDPRLKTNNGKGNLK